MNEHYDVVNEHYCFDNKYLACYNIFYNGIVMKTLNVHISGSNDLIDLPFTGGVYHIIRCPNTEYLRTLKFFIILIFLEILEYIYTLWSCKDNVQLK